jgi:hypothetical protein
MYELLLLLFSLLNFLLAATLVIITLYRAPHVCRYRLHRAGLFIAHDHTRSGGSLAQIQVDWHRVCARRVRPFFQRGVAFYFLRYAHAACRHV